MLPTQVHVLSTWRDDLPDICNSSTVTERLRTTDQEVQAIARAGVGTQTELDAQPQAKPSKKEQAGLPAFLDRCACSTV